MHNALKSIQDKIEMSVNENLKKDIEISGGVDLI